MVGRATNFTASGTLNPDDTMFGFDIFVFLKNADADPTCAADFDSESANSPALGRQRVLGQPRFGGFQVGTGSAFNQPFKITFTGAGNYLLCGYVQGDFSTFASGELRGAVAPRPDRRRTAGQKTPTPGSTTPARHHPDPRGARRRAAPWITRKRHALTCHAGTWSNKPTSLSYRWSVKGRTKTVASRSKLIVRRSLRGRMIACRVTARNAAGHKTASSRPVRAR